MNNVHEISMLLDFYGLMLTQRQYEIMDLHYNNDYSLAEIAEQLNISRQGVYDNIKRGREALNELEIKLGLVNKFGEQRAKAKELLNLIGEIDKTKLDEKDQSKLFLVTEGIKEIINKV